MYKAVSKAFQEMASAHHYHGRWITDTDVALVLCHEYDVPLSKELTAGTLNNSISRSDCYGNLVDLMTFENDTGIFRMDYSPRNKVDGSRNTGRRRCYYLTFPGEKPSHIPKGTDWKSHVCVLRISREKFCTGITSEMKQSLSKNLMDSSITTPSASKKTAIVTAPPFKIGSD